MSQYANLAKAGDPKQRNPQAPELASESKENLNLNSSSLYSSQNEHLASVSSLPSKLSDVYEGQSGMASDA